MTDSLYAYKNAIMVGTLTRVNGDNYVFQYDPKWLDSKSPLPLSLQLPLQEETFSPEVSKTFFANLLPEGQVREYYANKYRIPQEDDFELLAKLAGDCAGAIALFPEGTAPPFAGGEEYRPLSDDDIEHVFEQPYIMDLAFLDQGENIRLSLAGAQDKLPIAIIEEGQISLPQNGAASTHILKPQNPRFPSLVENELFCLHLAKELGLTVPETFLLKLAGEFNYVIERYDRSRGEDGKISKIHQEDFCQATGTSYRHKYEENGGPGHQACFEVIKKCRRPLADRITLVNLVIFNYLICNADCHAKNLSLLYNESKSPNLAPFYDLVCTAVYPQHAQTLAMSIGGDFDPKSMTLKSWETFSRQIGEASPKPAFRALESMAKEISAKAEIVAEDLSRQYGANKIYPEIVRVISQRAGTTLRQLKNK